MSDRKATPKRIITEQDVERIMRTAPDWILDAADDIQDLWVSSEWAKEERDLSPRRYFDITLNAGTAKEKEIHIDFQQTVNPSAVIKSAGGSLEDMQKANGARLGYLALDRAYNNAVLALNTAMGIRSRKPRNIVDYTGTIMELFGKFYTVADVHNVLSKEYRIKVPEDELRKFYVEHRDLITKRRAEYVLNSKEFRIATETGRLEILNRLLVEFEIKNKNAGGSNLEISNMILKIVEQARKEVKGNELKMTVDGRIDVSATVHAESNVVDVMKHLSINALVIGLTAAKAGLNPAVLIGQLANSWYSQFNGFNGNIMEGKEVRLPSALIRSYDWDKIEDGSKAFVGEFTPISEVVDEQDDIARGQGESRREELINRLRNIKNAKNKEQERANPYTTDGLSEETSGGLVAAPVERGEGSAEPKHEFEVDYALNNNQKQKHNIRIRGKIHESIKRHAAQREEESVKRRSRALRKKDAQKPTNE